MSQEEIDYSRRAFLERMKKTAIWAAPAITAISITPRKAFAAPVGESS